MFKKRESYIIVNKVAAVLINFNLMLTHYLILQHQPEFVNAFLPPPITNNI